jgi:hypothetical protein
MRLTPDLAKKYAAYRNRFIGGPEGLYNGFPSDIVDPCSTGADRRYSKDGRAPFMVTTGAPGTDLGTYLHVDDFEVEDLPAEQLEHARINKIKFGDNTVYSSVAIVCFAAEYAVGGLLESLQYVANIAESFQRLGTHQAGFGEEASSPPFGFVLRADSKDWAGDTDAVENFCGYGDGSTPTAAQLAPSLDQYAAILSCCLFAKRLVEQAPAATSGSEQALRTGAISLLSERIRTVQDFIALKTLYTIRWRVGNTTYSPPANRGPFCHPVAYPFAVIRADVEGNANNYIPYLGEVGIPVATQLLQALLQAINDLLQDTDRTIMNYVRGLFPQRVRDHIGGDVWDAIAKFFPLGDIILDVFTQNVIPLVINQIIDPILQHVNSWGGLPGSQAMNVFLAQQLFNLFVTGTLLDTSDQPFEDLTLTVTLSQLFELVGTTTLQTTIPVNYSHTFAPGKPGWWNEAILGNWPAPSWTISLPSFDIPLGDLLNVSLPIPMTGFLRQAVAIARGKAYLRFLTYNLMVAAGLSGQIGNTDSRALAARYNNSWFMALAHRFDGVAIGQPEVQSTLNILESAPETFPKGRGSGQWNQDFRWIRDIEDKNAAALYSGLDFMAPLMVACSTSGDIAANRATLLEALSPTIGEDLFMGPFVLPFQGPITARKEIFSSKTGGTQPATTLYVAVVFDRQVGTDTVELEIPTLQSPGTASVTFSQGDRCSQLVACSMTDRPIVLVSASATAKGYILISAEN